MAFLSSLPLLSLLLLLSTASAAPQSCNRDDKKALLAVKSSLGNPPLLSSWNPAGTTCCGSWTGIECDPKTGRVTKLTITGTGKKTDATGTIHPAVGDLRFLTDLTITDLPGLVGTLPRTLTGLAGLKVILVNFNGLSGSIPPFLASIKTLETIGLNDNRFTGSIPSELASLPRLAYLNLGSNQLTGSIPDSFGKLAAGSQLRLAGNKLTGTVPKSLGAVDFEILDLSENRLYGDVSFLFRPVKTTYDQHIHISSNMFEFDLSKLRFQLSLESLLLDHNKIYGSLPAQIGDLRQLEYLDVSYNRLCGKIPKWGIRYDEDKYAGNKCLCGAPLPPCK